MNEWMNESINQTRHITSMFDARRNYIIDAPDTASTRSYSLAVFVFVFVVAAVVIVIVSIIETINVGTM